MLGAILVNFSGKASICIVGSHQSCWHQFLLLEKRNSVTDTCEHVELSAAAGTNRFVATELLRKSWTSLKEN